MNRTHYNVQRHCVGATIREETKMVKKHMNRKFDDITDHVDRAVMEGAEYVTEKTT